MEATLTALLLYLHATQIMAFESAAVNTYSANQVHTGPAPTNPSDQEVSHLGQGSRAGIATCAIFGAILLFAIGFFVCKRAKRALLEKASQERYLESQAGGPNPKAFDQNVAVRPPGSPDLHLPLAHIQRSKELED